MAKISEMVSLTELGNNVEKAFDRVEGGHELLCLLARGEKEIAEDSGHDLDAVLEEADALLER